MHPTPHPTIPAPKAPKWIYWLGGISIGFIVFFCSCIILLYYIGSSMTPEQRASFRATSTARAIADITSDKATIFPTNKPSSIAMTNTALPTKILTDTSVPTSTPTPIETPTPIDTPMPTHTSTPINVIQDPSDDETITLGRNLSQISEPLNLLGYDLEKVDTDDGYNIYEASQGNVRVSVIGTETDTVRVSVLYIAAEKNDSAQALEAAYTLFAAAAPDWDNKEWIESEFRQALEATSNYDHEIDIGNGRTATARVTYLLVGNAIALAVQTSSSP